MFDLANQQIDPSYLKKYKKSILIILTFFLLYYILYASIRK